MKCPKCQTENPDAAKFCIECANPFEVQCPNCGVTNPVRAKFCMECAHSLKDQAETPPEIQPESKIEASASETAESKDSNQFTAGERKHVTVLFSDLSGYTAMSEIMDPEEVKEVVSRIFGQIKSVIAKYEGFIEKFAGDAVLAIFGVPQSHEDDPVRAIKAAREIHDLVANLSPEFEEKIRQPLSMHSGVNTGLAVTGEVNPELGTHGVSGDALNLAARLSDQAGGRGNPGWLQYLSSCGEIFFFSGIRADDRQGQSRSDFDLQSFIGSRSARQFTPIIRFKR